MTRQEIARALRTAADLCDGAEWGDALSCAVRSMGLGRDEFYELCQSVEDSGADYSKPESPAVKKERLLQAAQRIEEGL